MDTFDTFDTFDTLKELMLSLNDLDTLKELILSANDLDIFLLFVASNAKGSDSVVGGVDEIPES